MMRGMAIASTLLAALITLVVAPTVHAKRFTSQDSEMLSTITKRFSAARRDSLDAMQASVSTHNLDVSECLSSIMESISLTDEIVSSASIFVLLSSAMESQTDEYLVDRALAEQIRHSLASIAETRRVINQQAGRCGGSAVVVSKGQILLSILDDSERILSSFGRRF